MPLTREEVNELFERSKNDRALIVGSEVRSLCVLALQALAPTQPTIEQCFAAGKGPEQSPGTFREGGLPNTPDERARFEAYMRGHCWHFGKYDEAKRGYDETVVRMLYGVWRDRGSLYAHPAQPADTKSHPTNARRIDNLRRIAADESVNAFARSICGEAATFLASAEQPADFQRHMERAAKAIEIVGADWKEAGEMWKFYAAEYLAKHIRALRPSEDA